MKNRVIWIMFMVVASISSGAWAVWSPNADPCFAFNLNFENNNEPCTIDAKAGLVGHYSTNLAKQDRSAEANATNHDIFENNVYSCPGLGTDANFMDCHDHDSTTPNDIRIRIPIQMTGTYAGYEGGDQMFDLAGTPGVGDGSPIRTWAFWMRFMPKDNKSAFLNSEASIIRLGAIKGGTGGAVGDPNFYWEIRLQNNKIQFTQKNGSAATSVLLTAETAQTVLQMGINMRQWHHVAIIVDRNVRENTKIFIDGLGRTTNVVDYRAYAANQLYKSSGTNPTYNPLMIGSGQKKCNELLDEIRMYKRALEPLSISILKQTTPDANHVIALLPIPGSSDVAVTTDVNWVPAGGVTSQKVYFGTDPGALVDVLDGSSGLNIAPKLYLNGGDNLILNTTYYWAIDSNYSGSWSMSPKFSFNTESGKAKNPIPTDGQQRVSGTNSNIIVKWDGPTTPPDSYSVYLSSDITRVEALDANFRILNGIDVQEANKIITTAGTVIYWKVVSNYPTQTITGDTWHFRKMPYEIVFNTKSGGKKARYSNHDVNSLAMVIKDANFNEVKYGSLELAGDANIAVFTFSTGFSYDSRYDIVVIPTYCADDVHTDLHPEYEVNQPRPLSLRVTGTGVQGNFYFDGQFKIDGNDITISGSSGDRYEIARCGGFPGPKGNSGDTGAGTFNDHSSSLIPGTNYWTSINCPTSITGYSATHKRVGGPGNLTGKFTVLPTALAKTVFGPGQPACPPYKSGSGGSYGGEGGNGARAYDFAVETTVGLTYGDTKIPFPFGGSAGGWASNNGGCSGGGGVEIIAVGDVNLDAHSAITANGGSQLCTAVTYAAGGGSGGSVKVIAGGKFSNRGTITVNGGSGGEAAAQPNCAGGGGGGGRIAVNYATLGMNTGTMQALGGAKGYYVDYGSALTSLAADGAPGTILLTTDSPKMASAPAPKNGDTKAYIGGTKNDPCTGFVLSWYSGYGASTDRVWMGTSSTNLVIQGSDVTATRGKHTQTVSVLNNKTYYWRVKTDSAGTEVLSPIWSFSTVSWECPLAVNYGVKHAQMFFVAITDDANMGIGGPEWDHNRDCVLNDADFWFFAKDWQNQDLGLSTYPPNTAGNFPTNVNMRALRRLAFEWLDCYARTNNGCNVPNQW